MSKIDTDKLLTSGAGLVAGLITPSSLGQPVNTEAEEAAMNNIGNYNLSNVNDLDTLQQLYQQGMGTNTMFNWETWRPDSMQKILGTVGDTLNGVQQGQQFGSSFGSSWGGYAGAALGGIAHMSKSLIEGKLKDDEAKQRAVQLHELGEQKKQQLKNNIETVNMNIMQDKTKQAYLHSAAYGGHMPTGDFTNGMTFFSEGGSHEENPYQGIQQGIAPDGKPNLVEEGEWKYNDYIYSKRLKVPKKDYELLGLKTNKEYSYADAAEILQKESEERPNDPISKKQLDVMMERLKNSQETLKQKRDAMKMKREFEKLSPEEQAYIIQAMSQPQQAVPVQVQQMAVGGHLFEGDETLTNNLEKAKIIDGEATVPDTIVTGINGVPKYGYPSLQALAPTYKPLPTLSTPIKKSYSFQMPNRFQNSMEQTMKAKSEARVDRLKKAAGMTTSYVPGETSFSSTIPTLQDLQYRQLVDKESEQLSKRLGDVDKGVESGGSEDTSSNPLSLAQALRAAPVIGSGIGALSALMDSPNYSNIQRAENMYQQIPVVSPKPIGNKMTYNPMDVNYLMTQVGNQNIGNRRAIMESGAGNPGAVANALLAANYKGTTAMGEAFRQANKYNLENKQLVDEFNRGTDRYNSEADFDGQVQNQQRANILANAFLKTGMLRDEELAKVQANKSAAISSFLNNMGNLGTDMLNRDMMSALIEDGVFGTLGKGTSKRATKHLGAKANKSNKKKGNE